MQARAGTLADLFAGAFSQATQMDAEKFCAQFLPDAMPEDFSALAIPLMVDGHRSASARGSAAVVADRCGRRSPPRLRCPA